MASQYIFAKICSQLSPQVNAAKPAKPSQWFTFQGSHANADLEQEQASTEQPEKSYPQPPSLNFITLSYAESFTGLMTLPCHGLVDTGAQEGVIGMWHVQRWLVCLAMVHGLKLRFISLPPHCEAGGLGGSAKPIILADVPTGLASVNGVSRWLVVDDTSMEFRVPPHIPINLLKHVGLCD